MKTIAEHCHIHGTETPARYQHMALFGFVLSIAASYFFAETFQSDNSDAKSQLGHWTLLQYGLASLAMIFVWRSLIPNTHDLSYSPLNIPRSRLSQTLSLYDVRWIIFAGVVARLLLIPIEGYTSNDVSRYLFDGRLWWEGFDPYSISHDAAELVVLREQWAPPAEHAAYVTIYPPLALSIFTLSASVGVEWASLVWKIIIASASIATVFICALILQKRQALHHLPLIALSPLLILETGVGGHLDSLTTLSVAAALWYWQKERWLACAIIIGLGTLIKFLPLVLLGPIFLALSSWKQRGLLTAGFLVTLVIGYALIITAGLHPIGSLSVFFEKWRFGSPLYNSLAFFISPEKMSITIPLLTIFAMAMVGLYILKDSPTSKKTKSLHGMQMTFAIPLLLSPVVFPWYLMPLVPLMMLSPKAYLLLWLSLAPLTYEVLGQFACCNLWQPATWPLWVLGSGIVLGIAIDLRKLLFHQHSTITQPQDKSYV